MGEKHAGKYKSTNAPKSMHNQKGTSIKQAFNTVVNKKLKKNSGETVLLAGFNKANHTILEKQMDK